MYVHLFWSLPEDSDLSRKHVEEFLFMDNL